MENVPIRHTFLCPVAGGWGIRGSILRDHLNYKLFHPKHMPRQYHDILGVGQMLHYNALSGDSNTGMLPIQEHFCEIRDDIVDIPSHWISYIKDLDKLGLDIKSG